MSTTNSDSCKGTIGIGLAGAVALGLTACGGGSGDSAGGGEAKPEGGDPAAAAAPSAPAGPTMELKPEYPKPMFVGTPVPVKLPHLEEPGTAKFTVDVAEGTTLLSQGKPVTGSDDLPTIGELTFITDGDKDGGDGYYVELGPDLQWVQIDLEAESDVQAVCVWHFHKNARAYHDVIIQVSNDPNFESDDVITVYNNDHDNSSGLGQGNDKAYIETNHGRLIGTGGAKGRYVRLYSSGNTADDLNHYVEVEVFGKAS